MSAIAANTHRPTSPQSRTYSPTIWRSTRPTGSPRDSWAPSTTSRAWGTRSRCSPKAPWACRPRSDFRLPAPGDRHCLAGRQELSRRFGADVVVDRPGRCRRGDHGTDRPTISGSRWSRSARVWPTSSSTAACPGGRERLTRIFRRRLTGKVDPAPMTTHEFGFDEIERAFAMMRDKEDGIIKPLIHFKLSSPRTRVPPPGRSSRLACHRRAAVRTRPPGPRSRTRNASCVESADGVARRERSPTTISTSPPHEPRPVCTPESDDDGASSI